MNSEPAGDAGSAGPPISVYELRDYHQINAELVRRLNRGDSHVRLEGSEGHRLLLSGLKGLWRATVEILGNAGPELCAGMDAPNITVVCRGSSADGAASGLLAGTLLLLGPSGTALGYCQRGGVVVAGQSVGPRAGLGMRGGDLIVLGSAGPLAGELQRGGRLFLPGSGVGSHCGWNAVGGERHSILSGVSLNGSNNEERQVVNAAAALLSRFDQQHSG